ncbi:cilia- and flagella-associated protein 73 isoform X2 [Podarcis raffonei]|uniref:cilia- and flagella-associated protein 73 isoform X2 n=1 Tax=Podarcis raffonei TaxID=65483 RepID=UPI0023298096|nr:cilia- and flagella-associated protein 73 isoform X2 [Podarcis raffonei]
MDSDLEERVRAALLDKLQMMKIPEREEDFLPPACCLLEKQRELAEVEQALLAQKEEFQLKMEELQQRRKELELKEGQLKKSILKFDKFLKDNDAKRSRALRKAGEEKQQAAQREAEAERLKEEIAHLLSVKEKLQWQLERHKAFPEYLQKVLEKTEQFQGIPELIAQFQALMATQATLAQRELFGQEAVEEERARLQRYTEERSNQILQQNNRVAELQAQLEQAQTRVLELVELCVVDLNDILANFRKGEPTPVPQPETAAASRSETDPS